MKAYPARTPRADGGGRCRLTAIGGGRGRYTRAARKTRGQSRGDRTTECGPRSQPRAAHLYTGGAGRRSWRGGVIGEAGRGAGVLASAMEPHCRRHGDERPQSLSLEDMATGTSQADGDCGERASEPWWASTPPGGMGSPINGWMCRRVRKDGSCWALWARFFSRELTGFGYGPSFSEVKSELK
ncbi:uncharacterized protein LOC120665251 [Panicum virgatum]|uniref:uncharacterized protein LOC120665251 n=1 Tax=Panicum virgatum TaxID=38727 RepID=UPI0019D5D963|nr:uncharacterized protein LOC120665251 [Panicum virgatum]